MIQHYVFKQLEFDFVKIQIQNFCQNVLEEYGIFDTNLLNLFHSGVLLAYLLNYFDQSLIDVEQFQKSSQSSLEGNILVTNLAKEKFGIPILIDPKDVKDCTCQKSVFLYLYYFFECFKSMNGKQDNSPEMKVEGTNEKKENENSVDIDTSGDNLLKMMQKMSNIFLTEIKSLKTEMKRQNDELLTKIAEQTDIIQSQTALIENLQNNYEIKLREQNKEIQEVKEQNETILQEVINIREGSIKNELSEVDSVRKLSLSIDNDSFTSLPDDSVPSTFIELLTNQKGVQFYLRKFPDDERYINSYQNIIKLKDQISKYLSNDNYLIQMEKIYYILENMNDKSYIDLIDHERYRSKDPKTFKEVYEKLDVFLAQKYEKLKNDTMWNEIHKIHTKPNESRLRTLSFWKGSDQSPSKKKNQPEELVPYEKVFLKSSSLDIFKKYAEHEKCMEELEAMIEIKSYNDLSSDLLKDKKLNELYEKIYNTYKLMNPHCSPVLVPDLMNLDKIESDLFNYLQDNFQVFQRSLFWDEFLRQSKENKLAKKNSGGLLPLRKKSSGSNFSFDVEQRRKGSGVYEEEKRRSVMMDDERRKSMRDEDRKRLSSAFETEELRKKNSSGDSPLTRLRSPRFELLDEIVKKRSSAPPKNNVHPEDSPSIQITPMTPTVIEVESPSPKKKEMSKEALLFETARAGKLSEFQDLCKKTNDWKSLLDKEGRTFLHTVVISKNVDFVEYLIKLGFNIDAEDKEYKTPLFYAILSGSREVVLYLLGNKCKVNIKDVNGMCPLMICLRKHYFEIADDLLLFNANINFKRDNGYTVLHDAVSSEDLESIQWILKQKIKFNYNQKDSSDQTAFVKSLDCNNPLIFLELINVQAIDLSSKDERNFIHLLIQKQKVDFLKVFIGKEDLKRFLKYFQQSYQGKFPIHMAVETKNFKLVATLATILKSLNIKLNVINATHQTPLDLIIDIAEKSVGSFLSKTSSDEQKKTMENVVKIRKFLENNLND